MFENEKEGDGGKWKLSYCRYSDLLLFKSSCYFQLKTTAIHLGRWPLLECDFNSIVVNVQFPHKTVWHSCVVDVVLHVKTFWQNPDQQATCDSTKEHFGVGGHDLGWNQTILAGHELKWPAKWNCCVAEEIIVKVHTLCLIFGISVDWL